MKYKVMIGTAAAVMSVSSATEQQAAGAGENDRRLSGSELNELPLDSSLVRPHVARMRQAARAELQAEDNTTTPDFSDQFLVKFLRARDFDAEPALKLLLNYQRWRRQSPEISTSLSPTSVLGLLNNGYHAVLPRRDHGGSRVLVYRIGKWNPKEWSAFQVFSISMMTSELISREAETQRRGLKVIFDLEGWSFSHAIQFNPSLARKISSVLMDSFPLKVRGIHLINEPMFFQPVFAMLRPFLSDKIRSRIHMHGRGFVDTLTDYFAMSLLPPDLGGDGPDIEDACREWTNQLLQSESLLEQIAVHATGDVAASPSLFHHPKDATVSSSHSSPLHPNDTSKDATVSSHSSPFHPNDTSKDATVSHSSLLHHPNDTSKDATVSSHSSQNPVSDG